jgi:hypothetical protein
MAVKVFCGHTVGGYGTAVCVDVFPMLPLTILHEEVTYGKQI